MFLPKPTGSISSTVLSDVDGNGKLDVVYVCNNKLCVDFGLGAGKFSQPTQNPDTLAIDAKVVSADFTNDGLADMLVAGPVNTVRAYKSAAGGTLQFNGSYSTPSAVVALNFADFNLDGRLDGVVACVSANSILALINTGNGIFTPAGPSASAIGPVEVETNDINSDGKPDCLTANSSGSLSYFRGTGTGSFFTSVTIPAIASLKTISVHDFDGDSIPDVMMSSSSQTSYIKGPINVPTAPVQTTIPALNKIRLGDLNLDGIADVYGTDGTTLKMSEGTGGFGFVNHTQKFAGGTVLAADLTGDARIDALVVGTEHRIYPGKSPFAFSTAGTIPQTGPLAGILFRDLNHDGKPELIGFDTAAKSLRVFDWSGTALSLSYSVPIAPTGDQPFDLLLLDFNDDGYEDYLVGKSNGSGFGAALGLGNSTGTFQPPIQIKTLTTGTTAAVSAFDSNADGKVDILTADATANVVSSQLNLGGGVFGPVIPVESHFERDIAAGDFNNDGLVDVMLSNQQAGGLVVYVRFGNGQGAFPVDGGSYFMFASIVSPDASVAYDFDGDGTLDVLHRNTNAITAFWNIASAASFSPLILAKTGNGFGIVIKDFNGDGIEDLATTSSAQNFAIAYGMPSGQYATPVYYAAGALPNSIASTDLNGDGRADIVVSSSLSSTAGAVVLDLTPGMPNTTVLGTDSPSCFGSQILTTNSAPAIGNSQFQIVSDNGPRQSIGVLYVTDVAGTGNDPFGLGVATWVDLFLTSEFFMFEIATDHGGATRVSAPIPNDLSLSGKNYIAQGFYLESQFERCSLSPVHLSATSGLQIHIP